MLLGPLTEIQNRSSNDEVTRMMVAVPLFRELDAKQRSELQSKLVQESFVRLSICNLSLAACNS